MAASLERGMLSCLSPREVLRHYHYVLCKLFIKQEMRTDWQGSEK
jgi:hypothetical protein